MRNFSKFEIYYRGLTNYKPQEINLKEDEIEKERIESKHHSFLTFVLMFILIASCLTGLIVRREITNDYWLKKSIIDIIIEPFAPNRTFYEMTSINDFKLFMSKVLAPSLFGDDSVEKRGLGDSMIPIGPIRFRVANT